MDVLILSRLQFALTIMFHYLFPPLTIGLGVILVYLEGMYLWRRELIGMLFVISTLYASYCRWRGTLFDR